MGVGALAMYGRQPDYRGYEATGNKQIDDFYGGMSSAANKAETESAGEILGLTTIPYSDMLSYGMTAKYSAASTAADPIVQVSCNYGGEHRVYDIHVNDVNPRNASQIEMFALCCYTDDQGITDGGTFGSFSKMKTIAGNAAYNGKFADLQDPANVGGRFDWVSMLEEMADAYLGNPVVYKLYLDATNLAAAMGKWSDTHSMDFEKSLSCHYAAESTEKDPVVEVSVKRHGETVTEKVHINDVDPKKATQQEIYAYLYHYDQLHGTEGSYDTLMDYAETASKRGYWDKNDSFEAFSEDTHDWTKMFTNVWSGAGQLGLNPEVCGMTEGNAAFEIYHSMEKDHLKFLDFDISKAVDMSAHTSLKYIPPDVPREISVALYNRLYGQDFTLSADAPNVDLILFKIAPVLRRIEEQINADGSRDSLEAAWDSAYKAIESMVSELDGFFGEKLGAGEKIQENVQELKEQYESLLEYIDGVRNSEAQAGDRSDEAEEEDIRTFLLEYAADLFERIINGDTEQTFMIGSISLTVKEWERLLDKFDEIEEEIRMQIKEEIRKIKEAEGIVNTEKEPVDEGTVLTSEVVTNSFGMGTLSDPGPSYITCFTAEGIICTKKGSAFGQYLWKLDYQKEGDYDKVMDMLHSFPSDWNLRFASNESFWKDYLDDKIDKNDFVQYMNEYTDKGKLNCLIERDGSTYVNYDALKYSKYLNDPETKMYTAEEFTEMIVKQIEDNNRKFIDPNDSAVLAYLENMLMAFRRAMLGANY